MVEDGAGRRLVTLQAKRRRPERHPGHPYTAAAQESVFHHPHRDLDPTRITILTYGRSVHETVSPLVTPTMATRRLGRIIDNTRAERARAEACELPAARGCQRAQPRSR